MFNLVSNTRTARGNRKLIVAASLLLGAFISINPAQSGILAVGVKGADKDASPASVTEQAGARKRAIGVRKPVRRLKGGKTEVQQVSKQKRSVAKPRLRNVPHPNRHYDRLQKHLRPQTAEKAWYDSL